MTFDRVGRIAELEAALREIADRAEREPLIESPGWSYVRAVARRALGEAT